MEIEENALIWLHPGIRGLGMLKGGIDCITRAFRQILPHGALVIPTFTYSWCNSEVYLKGETPCQKMGAYASRVWKEHNFVRNENPNFSVAVMDQTGGEVAAAVCEESTRLDCFGENSAFQNLWRVAQDRPAYILLLGGAHDDVVFRSTFLHMVEEKVGVPYRFLKTFSNPENNGESCLQYVRYFSRGEYDQLNPNQEPGFSFPVNEQYHQMGIDLQETGLLRSRPYGYSDTRMVPLAAFCGWLEHKIGQLPSYLLS